MISLDQTILNNLLVEREMAIAKITFTTQRLEQLEEQIRMLRGKIETDCTITKDVL